jgi:hypothetical protein
MTMKAFIFECSTATYLDCVQKSLFGSNLPWPLQIKTGDYCCLYHYEVGTLFALWQATSGGGKNLVPKVWGGRYPFQAKVALATPEILEIPKAKVAEEFLNPATGKFDNVLEGPRADSLLSAVRSSSPK